MSWSKCAGFLIFLTLGGCFQPMYGDRGGLERQKYLASISVDPIPERGGHYLRNALLFELHRGENTPPPLYRLKVTLREERQTPIVDTITSHATAATLVMDAHYQLFSLQTGKVIKEGIAFQAVSYDRVNQGYADIKADQDAQTRVARAIAEQIRIRLAAEFGF